MENKEQICTTLPQIKMYCIVLKQLSPIQKGIQAAHAICEYGIKFFDNKKYQDWLMSYKTIVALNAKDYNDLKDVIKNLERLTVPYAYFSETSLNDIITAVCFLYEDFDVDTIEDEVFKEYVEDFRNIFISKHLAN